MPRILIADDNELVRDMMMVSLQRAGHQVVGVEDGHTCLESAASQAFDLVITDLFMPCGDGLDVIAGLRASHPDLPIIGVTGGIEGMVAPFVNALLAMGVATVLCKPFLPKELVAAVDTALRSAT
jgi:CheY-like chemotaxis protein